MTARSGRQLFAIHCLSAEVHLVQSSYENLLRLLCVSSQVDNLHLHGSGDCGAFGSERSDSASHDDRAIHQRTLRGRQRPRESGIREPVIIGRMWAMRWTNRAAELERTNDIRASYTGAKNKPLLGFEPRNRRSGQGQLSERHVRKGGSGERQYGATDLTVRIQSEMDPRQQIDAGDVNGMGCRGQVVEWDASSVPMPCWRCRERVTTLHTNRRHRAVRRRILGSDALANRHRTAGVTSTQVRVLAVPRQAQPPSAPRREPSLSWTTRERVGQRALSAGGRVGWPDAPRASRVREAPQFRFRSSAQGGQQLFRRRGPSRIPGDPLRGLNPRPKGEMES